MMRDRLTKREFWLAMLLMVLHVAVFPIALSIFLQAFPDALGEEQANLLYYALSLLLTIIFLGRYLRRSFDGLADAPGRSILTLLIGWGLYIVLSIAASYILQALDINTDNLNEDAINDMLGENRGMIIAMTVFLAPVVEESIFRGGLFCGIWHHSRVLAYIVSVLAFSLYHVWQYAVALGDVTYLLLAIQYIAPAFVLCWVYERSGSVWTSIFFHMSVNAVAIFATQTAII